ncbi:hypothetical protein EFL05_13640 [Enterococcus faecalis]|nr:hypothetical protein [Enterococcus faecalis]
MKVSKGRDGNLSLNTRNFIVRGIVVVLKILTSKKIFQMVIPYVIVFGIFGFTSTTYAQGGADTTASDWFLHHGDYYTHSTLEMLSMGCETF